MATSTPDLTQRPPRSPRVRLGGYVILPRTLDKCRALLAGKNGEYDFNCPLDQMFFEFAGIDAEQFKQQAAAGKGDAEILQWVVANAKNKARPEQIEAWAHYVERRVPTSVEVREYFHDLHKKAASHREDVAGWFDLLDVDDFVTFGGKA